MIRIYTDIDYVLHYYSAPYFKAAKNIHKFHIPPELYEEESVREMAPMKDSLSLHSNMFGMTEEQIWECVRYVNTFRTWVPTSFGKTLGKYLGTMANRPDIEVIAVTARGNDRQAASAIVEQATGQKIPVICCDTEHKHHVIHDEDCDKVLYFEDHPVAALNVAKKFTKEESRVIVPEWPWNRVQIGRAVDNGRKNVWLLKPIYMDQALEYRIHQEEKVNA